MLFIDSLMVFLRATLHRLNFNFNIMMSLGSPWLLFPERNRYPFSSRLGKPSAALLVNNLLGTNMVRRFASHTCLSGWPIQRGTTLFVKRASAVHQMRSVQVEDVNRRYHEGRCSCNLGQRYASMLA